MLQFVLAVTPGPRQHADLESFLHPIAEELDKLAQGSSGVKVAGRDTTSVLRAFVLQFTTDMPAGDNVAVVATAGMVLELHKVVEEQAYPGWVFVIREDLEPPTWLEIMYEMPEA